MIFGPSSAALATQYRERLRASHRKRASRYWGSRPLFERQQLRLVLKTKREQEIQQIQKWQQSEFNNINSLTGSLFNKLQKLLYAIDDDKYDALELSVYSWAIHDPIAKEIMLRVVDKRLEWCTNLFLEGGLKGRSGKAGQHCSPFHGRI